MEFKYGFIISFLAGVSTLIGSLLIFIKKKKSDNFIISALAFASSIMITISITNLIPESINLLKTKFTNIFTIILVLIFIVIGIIVSLLIEKLVPNSKQNNSNLYKVGIISMITIILHNIPEGMATFIATSNNLKLGIILAVSIALHNIPEGISISFPIFYATGSKRKALFYTFLSGMSEPLGALLAYFLLSPFINNITLGILFAIISGIMIHVSMYEILPASLNYNKKKKTIIFFIIGIIVVLITNLFL